MKGVTTSAMLPCTDIVKLLRGEGNMRHPNERNCSPKSKPVKLAQEEGKNKWKSAKKENVSGAKEKEKTMKSKKKGPTPEDTGDADFMENFGNSRLKWVD